LRLARVLPLGACVLLALVAAACFGGGGGGGSGDAPDLDKIPTATLPAELPQLRILGESAVSTGGRRTYTIRSGDTFSAVADRFGITLEDLIEANPDVDPTGLVEGDVINLPEDSGSPVAATATPEGPTDPEETTVPDPVEEEPTVVEELPTATPEPLPPTQEPPPVVETPTAQSLGTTYVVQSGDTFASIAARFNVTIESLQAANPQADSNSLQVGQVLFIPPSG